MYCFFFLEVTTNCQDKLYERQPDGEDDKPSLLDVHLKVVVLKKELVVGKNTQNGHKFKSTWRWEQLTVDHNIIAADWS